MNNFLKALIILGSVALIGIIVGLAAWTPEEKNFIEQVDDEAWAFSPMNDSVWCDNRTTEIAFQIMVPGIETPLEKKAFLFGYASVNGYIRDETEPILTIILSCINETKEYYNYSDFPEGDDCIDDNHCFIKWSDAEEVGAEE